MITRLRLHHQKKSVDYNLNSLGRSRRQGVNFDVNGVMNELFGWEKQKLCFTKVKCGHIQETSCLRLIQRKGQVQLGVIHRAVV